MGLEPTRPKDTWPSTMPVYQFQHPGGYSFSPKRLKQIKKCFKQKKLNRGLNFL